MSLVQHVGAVEGTDRLDIASLYDSPENISLPLGRRLSRTLSYDVLPKVEPAIEKPEPVGAYEVSVIKRIGSITPELSRLAAKKSVAQVITGVIICILASGVVFGFAALKEILVEEGVYQDLCTEDEISRDERLCYLQDQRLNLNFIVGSVTTNLSALLVGTILDRYGPFPCGIISSIILFTGSLCMAFAPSSPFDAYALSFFLFALGGTFTFVPSFQLANAFPRFQGLILSIITGAFDASSAIFLAFRLIYQSSDGKYGPRDLFLFYLTIPILMLVANIFLMPSRSYETRAELEDDMEHFVDNTLDVHDSDDELPSTAEIYRVRSKRAAKRAKSAAKITELIGDQSQQIEHEIKEDEKKITSGVWGVLHGMPARRQMVTPWFILIALFTVLQMTRFNFFISTVWSQYEYLLDSPERATKVTDFFDLALPIGGVVTAPFIGFLLDGTSTVTVLSLLVLISTVIGVLGAMPNATAAYLNVMLFVIFRPLYYSAMSDYAAKIFGFSTFGTVYGTMICLSGLSLFSQPALQALVHTVFYEDPGPINLYLAGAGLLIGLVLIMYVDAKAREIRRRQFQFMAVNAGTLDIDDERRSLLSVSLYEASMTGSGTLSRRRNGIRSPGAQPQDLGGIPNINPNLFYSYGALGVNVGTGVSEDGLPIISPYGSLRVRNSRQALGGGLRPVVEREEPEDVDHIRHKRRGKRMTMDGIPSTRKGQDVEAPTAQADFDTETTDGEDGDEEYLYESQSTVVQGDRNSGESSTHHERGGEQP